MLKHFNLNVGDVGTVNLTGVPDLCQLISDAALHHTSLGIGIADFPQDILVVGCLADHSRYFTVQLFEVLIYIMSL